MTVSSVNAAPRRGSVRPGAPATVSAGCRGELADVPGAEWDALIGPGGAALRHALLLAWEQAELAGLRSRPVVVAAPGRGHLVGAAPGYLYDLDLLTVRWPRAAPLMRAARRLWPRMLVTRSYEVGTALPLANPFLMEDVKDTAPIAEAMVRRMLEQARAGRASFIFVQNFTDRTGTIAERLRAEGFAPVRIPSTAVLEVTYSSFEEYLSSMRSPYRRRANRALARTSELSVEHVQDFSALAEEMARLWRAIYDRATEVRREILPAAFFRQAAAVPETSTLLVRRADGTIAAFALLLSDGQTLSFMQCGFEERAGRGEGSYFRLLYEIVRLGIEGNHRLVDLGITTLEPKLDVGAVPIPLYAWIRHRNPLVQLAISGVANSRLQGPRLQARRVFKQPQRPAQEIVAAIHAG